jgi:hypothetical protein
MFIFTSYQQNRNRSKIHKFKVSKKKKKFERIFFFFLEYAKCTFPAKDLKFSVKCLRRENDAVIIFRVKQGESWQFKKLVKTIARKFFKKLKFEGSKEEQRLSEILGNFFLKKQKKKKKFF